MEEIDRELFEGGWFEWDLAEDTCKFGEITPVRSGPIAGSPRLRTLTTPFSSTGFAGKLLLVKCCQ